MSYNELTLEPDLGSALGQNTNILTNSNNHLTSLIKYDIEYSYENRNHLYEHFKCFGKYSLEIYLNVLEN